MRRIDDMAQNEADFWAKVDKGGLGCWEWMGCRNQGYGDFSRKALPTSRAHRIAWMFLHGPIPDGKLVLHKCNNRGCVRPDHLYLGDERDNIRDAIRAGTVKTLFTKPTHCKRGHELTPENRLWRIAADSLP